MHVIIVTDAWYPHLSGVLRVVESLSGELDKRKVAHTILHPQSFPRIPVPGYSDIKIALPIFFDRTVDALRKEHKEVVIHIMTEGPLGLTMRNYCVARGLVFTTSFHTHWHKYIRVYFKIPQKVTMRYVRDFHKPSQRVLVPSEEAKMELEEHKFENEILVCANGVDTTLFRPRPKKEKTRRPRMVYVGRVSKEKSIEDFLEVQVRGSKCVVGDGPLRESLSKRYPEVNFTGSLQGEKLAEAYANADVFVFPSKTDTFGVVLLEALASGTPVAAYPAPGPRAIITRDELGSLNTDLSKAIAAALEKGDSAACIAYAQTYSWKSITDTFLGALEPAGEADTTTKVITKHLLRIPQEFYKLFMHAGYARNLLFGFGRHNNTEEEK